ncbi:MAG: T9SS type A sorting domain-containing protein [Crocinitomicaceae bacterium]|nr:T9SS type A sorting domain-containing protein [Crocinitomicaceae bacterium]
MTVSQTGAFITIEPTTGTWPVYDKNSFTNYYQLEMLIEVNCENAGPVTLFDNYVHYDKFIYSDGACNEEVALTSSIIHPFSSPNLNFSFLNPVQDAFSPTTEFDFNVANLSSFSANYPYMLITYDPAVVSVTVPSFTSYAWSPGQLYVEITGVPAFTTLTDFISVSPLNCDVEQITEVVVESGYHCTGYPTSPGSFISGDYCPDQTDTLQLTILRSNLNVDLFTSFSPSEPVDHCDGKFSVVLQIYNDEKANITDLELQHPSTPGLTLLSTSYHYPIQTGEYFDPGLFAWSMVDPMDYLLIPGATSSAINSGYGFYNDGLDAQATLNGFLSNDGINLYNFYHVKLDFQVDCDYDISTPLQFKVSGLTNCGEPISIDLSTLIDFIPPIDNLQISMEISPTACESIDKTPDVFVEVLNSDTVAYDSLYVELFCDTDDNGIFDPFIDLFLSSQLLLVSGSTILNPGEIAMASFPASVSSSCPNGVYIATIANQNGCYCNYNHVIDTVDCCECAIVPSVSSVTHVVREIINMGAADQIRYALIGYPSAISNLTGNPYDPALYVYDLSVDAWIYPNQFNPPCLFFAFDMSWDSIFFQYNTDDVPLPHLIETKLVYPDVDQQGDTCETNLPICTGPQLKFDCPTCYVADIDTISCADTSSFLVTEEYLSFENNNDVKLISVYPNPVSENLYIKSDSKITAVRCYDSRGKLIINLELVESDEIILNLKGIACGVYFVNIVFDDGATLKEKIIKH